MKASKKILALALSAIMILSLLAGCSKSGEKTSDAPVGDNTKQPENSQPADDTPAAEGRVYWLNFKPESDGDLLKIAEMYTNKTGVPVKIITAASGTYSQTLNAEMGKSEAPTIFVVGNQAGVKDWSDYALDLKGTAIEAELNTDAYNLYDENGKLVSIGYCYECYGIIVNPDLVEQAGHKVEDI
ncbi:MAG: ABC transporter substrate-binding protein, partial [Oscillospiraceae bacterium]|nr:ABC transporter substrate-binding protein [Oscillospiraceae bacterium]